MPRYFFDVDDGKRQVLDPNGAVFIDNAAAVQEAVSMLSSLREIRVLEDRPGTTTVNVRNEDGESVFAGSAQLDDAE